VAGANPSSCLTAPPQPNSDPGEPPSIQTNRCRYGLGRTRPPTQRSRAASCRRSRSSESAAAPVGLVGRWFPRIGIRLSRRGQAAGRFWHGPPARQRPSRPVGLSGALFTLSARSAAQFSSNSGCQVVLGLVWGPRLAGRGLHCRFVDRLTGVAAVGGSARSSRRGGLPGLGLSNCLAAAAERRYVSLT
jgi:hypothetical protein